MSDVVVAEEIVRFGVSGRTKLIVAAAAATAVGFGVGFFTAKKLLTEGYADLATAEIEEAKEFYKNLYAPKAQPDVLSGADLREVTPSDAVDGVNQLMEPAVEAVRTYTGDFDEQQVTQVRNIFKNDGTEVDVIQDVWDIDTEMRMRTEDAPFIISHEEFLQGEKDYEQAAVTYYEEDETLVDERDQMIPDKDEKVGDHNLLRMGHGSDDPNKLYVRNDVIEVDFEIARSNGSYAREVLGFEHSDDAPRSRRGRPRWDDDERAR